MYLYTCTCIFPQIAVSSLIIVNDHHRHNFGANNMSLLKTAMLAVTAWLSTGTSTDDNLVSAEARTYGTLPIPNTSSDTKTIFLPTNFMESFAADSAVI